MTDYGEAFTWMTKDPQWVGKVLLIGLIAIIPIVGWMNLLGWMFASLANLRSGRTDLAAGNFSHIGRGARLFLVSLVYGLIASVLAGIFYAPGILLAATSRGDGAAAGLGVLLTSIGGLVAFAASLAVGWVQPIIYLRTDGGGIGAGLDFPGVIADLVANPFKTLLAALLMYVGGLIGAIGFVLCLIGAIFTEPYGYAMVAGVLRVYEQQINSTAPEPA